MSDYVTILVAIAAALIGPVCLYIGFRLGVRTVWRASGNDGDPGEKQRAPKMEQNETE